MEAMRTAVVTGGTGGIGLEVAKRLGRAGFRVAVPGIDAAAWAAAKAELEVLGIEAAFFPCDVTDEG
ncbi:MAG: SDR family NAD(P)-dependent oxidoreductase, partial [Spirochaetaceae bacterium]|nr:SDR family NAD(P)-dependent oxidoreductase [Spirochaetaceae bacterium]